jgi:hypothetical protein
VEGNDSTNPQGLTGHFSEGDDGMAEAMPSRTRMRGARPCWNHVRDKNLRG